MSRPATIHLGLTIALAVLMSSASLGCSATTAGPGVGRPAAAPDSPQTVVRATQERDVSDLIAKAHAAQRQHDFRLLRLFQASLIERVGLAKIDAARMSYQRALADLAAATAAGDSHARSVFRAQLGDLCRPDGLVSALEPCDAAVVVWGT
jgi:hypothetical protein